MISRRYRLPATWAGLVLFALDTAAPQAQNASMSDGLRTLFVIGDSTVKNGTPGQVGWGDRIGEYFDRAAITVTNVARGGRSSRTYQTEGLWNSVLDQLKPGDFVIMVGTLFPSDHTHTNSAGAELNAASVVSGLKALRPCIVCAYFSEKAAAVPARQ